MTAPKLQNLLHDLLDAVIEAREDEDDDHDLADLADLTVDAEAVRSVATYREAEILTHDSGLVVECEDGREFQVTIVQSR